MKMAIVLAVCLALAAACSTSASALQMSMLGAGAGAGAMMMGGAPYACAELLRQPQCSPVAAPWYLQQLAEQTMLPQSIICQPLRQQCCMQLSLMDVQSRCQAMCAVAQSVVQQLKLQMVMQQATAAGSLQMMLPASTQAITPVAMVVAQVAQNLPAMCGLYPVPSSCTHPCALSAAISTY